MPVNDELGKRMKSFYEEIPRTKLMRRTPVAMRIDGKAFHTFTRGFQKPFDPVLVKTMQETTKYLCENIQGCVFGYTQSDEITLILVDYKKLDTDAWFGYEVEKMCSIAASMTTMAFNKFFEKNYNEWGRETFSGWDEGGSNELGEPDKIALAEAYATALNKGAMFDCRVFNIPKEEVTNLVYWRQLDAARNSVQMVGQANFSHKELQNKTCNMIQDMLHEQKDINWNNFPTHLKRGTAVVRNEVEVDSTKFTISVFLRDRSKPAKEWIIDKEMPMLRGEDRAYLDELIFVGV